MQRAQISQSDERLKKETTCLWNEFK